MSKMYLGLNLSGQASYSTDQIFANLFLNCGGAGGGGPQTQTYDNPLPVPLDAQGWPTADFRVVIFAGGGQRMNMSPNGNYAIKFNGKATFGLLGGTITSQIYDAGTNTTTATLNVNITNPGNLTSAVVTVDFSNTQKTAGSATNTGITNIFIMRPIEENSLTPHNYGEFLSRVFTSYIANGGYQGIRYMDILGTNNFFWPQVSTLSWSQRTPGYSPNQSGFYNSSVGSSIEMCVAISNATNKDMWYCMPDPADADYMVKAMQTIAFGSDGLNPYTSPQQNPVCPPLNSNLKLFLEYGNEMWNPSFPQLARNLETAQAEITTSPIGSDGARSTTDQNGNHDNNYYVLGYRRVGEKLVQVSKAARQVFGDAAMMTRVLPVLMGWDSGDPSSLMNALTYVEGYYNNPLHVNDPHPVSYYFWGAGAGAYRNWTATDTSDTSGNTSYINNSSAYQTLANSILASGVVTGDQQGTYARPGFPALYGLKSVIYEAALDLGQDNATQFSYEFNQDQRLRPLVKQYYKSLNDVGYDIMFIYCSSIGNYSQARTAEPRDLAVAPRYLAAQDYAADSTIVKGSLTSPGFSNQTISIGAGSYTFTSSPLFYGSWNFSSDCVLNVEVSAIQDNMGDSLALIVDGNIVATGSVPSSALFTDQSGTQYLYSQGITAPITAGTHSISLVATQPITVRYNRTAIVSLATEQVTRTNFNVQTFNTVQQVYTSLVTPPSPNSWGMELTMTTTDYEVNNIILGINGCLVGFFGTAVFIKDSQGSAIVGTGTLRQGGVNGTLAGEIRGNTLRMYVNGCQVLEADNITNDPTAANYFYLDTTAHAGTTTPQMRQYTINSVDISVVLTPVISPVGGTVVGGQTQQFTSTSAVTWSVNHGTITSNGLFTAPSATSVVQTITITATSTVDNTKIGTTVVTILAVTSSGNYEDLLPLDEVVRIETYKAHKRIRSRNVSTVVYGQGS